MKKTFYVLRFKGGLARNTYVQTGGEMFTSGAIANASRFDTINEVLQACVERGRHPYGPGSLEIVRVTENTAEGTTHRVEVPLGDKQQIGVAVKGLGSTLWTGRRPMMDRWASIDVARVFPTIDAAAEELQDAAAAEGHRLIADHKTVPMFVGIAEKTIPGAVTFDEVVLG